MEHFRMDGLHTAKIFELPANSVRIGEPKPRWIIRRLFDLGILAMPNEKPPTGFQINYSTITVLISIMVFFGGITTFVWNTAYKQGQDEAEKKSMREELEKVKEDARRAKEWNMVQRDRAEQEEDKKKK